MRFKLENTYKIVTVSTLHMGKCDHHQMFENIKYFSSSNETLTQTGRGNKYKFVEWTFLITKLKLCYYELIPFSI